MCCSLEGEIRQHTTASHSNLLVCLTCYLPFLNFPGVALVFCFFLADPLASGMRAVTLRLDDREPVTVKKPLRMRSSLVTHLNCLSAHMNWTSPSSSGSFHFNSTELQSITSGSRNSPRASLYSQSSGTGCFWSRGISSIELCCLMRSMALLGPIPLMVPQ
uniref:Uncharacterized protein n=1 Tax=Paramormyrops kingsleyae TaxID=1676925 RepID=A0A3B3S4E7_9TELE